MRILHAASEIFPYVKVGGLGDVMAALPVAQRQLGADARVMLPGFGSLLAGVEGLEPVRTFPDLLGQGEARLLQGRTASGVPIYLLDHPALFNRDGGPYVEAGDSHLRFAAFAWACAQVGLHGDGRGWQPAIVQAHDWQAALAPAYMAQDAVTGPRSVMTIHNMAYQGLYPASLLPALWIGPTLFHPEGAEFYGRINFLKAGLAYASRITTVSPTYAREIQHHEAGFGLEGILARRRRDLSGILNGVDYDVWNPAATPHLQHHYDVRHMSGKKVAKNLLQRETGLAESPDRPLFGVVSRLVDQKGLDLVIENIAYLIQLDAQLVVLGTGDPRLEAALQAAAEAHPDSVAAVLDYDEGLAHRILAGSDVILVPSRHEPCGLTQLYALRYGSLPLVRKTGGLADTVVDANAHSLMDSTATGFVFKEASSWILGETIGRACRLYREDPKAWASVQRHAMTRNFSWKASAQEYLDLYASLLR
ncbi:glycogen synthase GlgA [Mesoterricola sediminis]|uniref:Glycogen synthase n=1 Tax=Mesoterricola sediminis TaxID=2927980 RepID=A0AA48GYY7_9BACT|nr:glycogen synthase GlgA [Mesoterricola sediminis]BDU76607.1 glycogen synthase [Mesoterricola sediminis]